MNVLLVMYGDLSSNSTYPMGLHAKGLSKPGHDCVAAVPSIGDSPHHATDAFKAVVYADVLADPAAVFRDGRPADVLHAWTPREGVRRFVTAYLSRRPTAWVIYLEDNEEWIARTALAPIGLREDVLLQHTDEVITTWTPDGISHPLRYRSFIGLADAAVVIQDKLAPEVPPWVPCSTVMPGVDLEFFSPAPAQPALRQRYGVADHERVIVYPGGLNNFTRPGLEALCRAVALVNRLGVHCRLLRSGPVALDFLDRMAPEDASYVSDLGPLPRADLPGLLALADVFVQPGTPNAFEDLRLPGKLPELLAMGRPVVLPDSNISGMLRDGVDALIHRTGSPEEIAEKCRELLLDPERAAMIGAAGRRFAETHFDPRVQSSRLEAAYRTALAAFRPEIAANVWGDSSVTRDTAGQLARKLRLLAESTDARPMPSQAVLSTHARLLEFARERAQGLEIGMAVRDHDISSLKDKVGAEGARIATLAGEVAARDRELGSAREMLAARDGELAKREARVLSLEQASAEQGARIAALESSLSWRLTRPIRTLLRLVRQALHRRR